MIGVRFRRFGSSSWMTVRFRADQVLAAASLVATCESRGLSVEWWVYQ